MQKPGEEREALDSTSGFWRGVFGENLGRSARRLIPPRVFAEQSKGEKPGEEREALDSTSGFLPTSGGGARSA
jgi:hypothetical protein